MKKMLSVAFLATTFIPSTAQAEQPMDGKASPAIAEMAAAGSNASFAEFKRYRYVGVAYFRKGGKDIDVNLSGEVAAENGDVATYLAGQAIEYSATVKRYKNQGWDYRGYRVRCEGPLP